jgi:hypothetical protein
MLRQRIHGTNAVLLLLALAMTGCGGGGGGAPSGSTPPPSTTPTDTTAPDTTITNAPSAVSNSSTASFNASSSELGSTFEASLDSAPFAPVTLPVQLSNLADGNHIFAIRARDAAGNVDATPATFSWTVNTSAPVVKILFPLPLSYTDASTLTVRGTTSAPNAFVSIAINSVAATSTDGFKTWSAVVPIHAGQNDLVVSTLDASGNTGANVATASVVNHGPVIGSFAGLAFDASTNQIIVGDGSLQSVYLFDPGTRLGKTLASYNGVSLTDVGALTLDAANHRALVIDRSRDALVAVDLSTGAAHDLSTTDPSNLISLLPSMTLDETHHAVFVGSANAVTRIDLDSGSRVLVSGGASNVGSGPAFNYPPLLALDTYTNPGTPRLVGAVTVDFNVGSASVIAVDPATGNRLVIAPTNANSAPLFRPTAVALDPSTHHLLVLNSAPQAALISVDLATGNRTVISDQSNSSDAPFAPERGLTINGGQVFVAQAHGEVLSVDLSTGARQTLLHSRIGNGPQFSQVSTAALEPSGSLLVLVGGRLTRVNPSTGDRTIVSSSLIGTGPFNNGGFAVMTLDSRASTAKPSALAILSGSSELVSIDLGTGDRTHLADLGLSFANVQGDLRLDAASDRIYFINIDDSGPLKHALYSYDLGTAQRTTISDGAFGGYYSLRDPKGFVLDKPRNRVIVSDPSAGGWISISLADGTRARFADDWSTVLGPGALYFDAAQSRLIGLKWAPIGARTSAPLAALKSFGGPIDDAALFTMMMMMEHPEGYTDVHGVYWPGGAANYNGTFDQRLTFATAYDLYPRIGNYDYIRSDLVSMPLPTGTPQKTISGPDLTLSMRGSGPAHMSATSIDVDPAAQVAYVPEVNTSAVMAIDLVSGDRVLISR